MCLGRRPYVMGRTNIKSSKVMYRLEGMRVWADEIEPVRPRLLTAGAVIKGSTYPFVLKRRDCGDVPVHTYKAGCKSPLFFGSISYSSSCNYK